jgi:hypothetical protein
VVRYDAGTAPRPFGGVCSLAICKPRIRAAAEVGDWVIGFRRQKPGEVIYVMQVTERLTLGEYWEDPRFRDRRPDATPLTDNFYRPGPNGALVYVENEVHKSDAARTDVSGRYVLLSERFWYFGGNSVPIPNELLHLVHATRGHSVHKGRKPEDERLLKRWLAAWKPGIHGKPIDRQVPDEYQGELRERPKRRASCSG